jgi:predicted O-methyltransferase YrrM
MPVQRILRSGRSWLSRWSPRRHRQPESVRPPADLFRLPERDILALLPLAETTDLGLMALQRRKHLWQMPLDELAILSLLARGTKPAAIFEIGTFTGASTLALLAGSLQQARVTTLDWNPHRFLPPEQAKIWPKYDSGELFAGLPQAAQIQQLYGDSTTFDFSPYERQFDLVFIDGAHDYPHVSRDTQNALTLLRPGGSIVWHDYRWGPDAPECIGVTDCVHELADAGFACVQVAGTRFATLLSIADPTAVLTAWLPRI